MTPKKMIISFCILFFCVSPCLAQGYDFLVREAERQFAAGEYQAAIDLYLNAFKSGEFHFNDYMNAAFSACRLKNKDLAFEYLGKAIEAGFSDRRVLTESRELKMLRSDQRWNSVLSQLGALEKMKKEFPEKAVEEGFILLPEPRLDSDFSIEKAIQDRRSVRSYQKQALTLQEVAQLLWAAYGLTQPRKNAPDYLRGGLRAAPSAGGRYPLEVYLAVKNVEGLEPGVYRYQSEKHGLVTVTLEDRWDAISEAAFNQPHFRSAAAALIYSAVFERSMVKYGQRARERYVCMDLGHSGENVYLQATALHIGTCAIGAFNDLWLKKAVGMTQDEEPLYIMPVGKM